MFKILFLIAIKSNLPAILRLASKLEFGAGIFCLKLATRARNEGYLDLAKYFHEQYSEEDAHGKMLGGLIDGVNRVKRNCSKGCHRSGKKFEPFDGISKRYWASRLYFGGKNPSELDWGDIVAFMTVIEEIVVDFYSALNQVNDSKIAAIALKIKDEEKLQINQLNSFLKALHHRPSRIIFKWRIRVALAVFGGMLDVLAIANQGNNIS